MTNEGIPARFFPTKCATRMLHIKKSSLIFATKMLHILSKTISIERHLKYPIQKVWEALTTPVILEKWFMESNFRPQLGADFYFHGTPREGWDGVILCKVTEIEPPYKLAYSWQGNHVEVVTQVQWELSEVGTGTMLKLKHSGFLETSVSPIDWFEEHVKGWNRILGQLTDFLTTKE